MTLEPAYGRNYKSIKEVKEAFNADKDFIIASVGPWMGKYINRQQLIGVEQFVMIRYAKLTKEVKMEVSAKGVVP
jgi:hypothetical protein